MNMKKPSSAVLGLVVLGVYACSAPYDFADPKCDPDAPFPSEICRKQFAADAGSEAGSGGSAGGATSQKTKCEPTGRCLDAPSGEYAGYYTDKPLVVWFGPTDKLASMKCPGDEKVGTPNEQFRLYKDLEAPPASCDPCACTTPAGDCAGLPDDIRIAAGPCAEVNASSVSFGGPTNWDGLCTNESAMPKGTMCGAEPCAQSIRASTLPAPTNETCKPDVLRPSFTKTTNWKTGVLACSAVREENDCVSTKQYCVNHVAGPEWQHCIHRVGVHSECPANYPYSAAVGYRGDVLDDRGCNECACGAAEGGGCLAQLAVYEDGACAQVPSDVKSVSSFMPTCFDVAMPGQALGSKTMSEPKYIAGACPASGGEPFGKAVADEKDAVTFCCAAPFYEIE